MQHISHKVYESVENYHFSPDVSLSAYLFHFHMFLINYFIVNQNDKLSYNYILYSKKSTLPISLHI